MASDGEPVVRNRKEKRRDRAFAKGYLEAVPKGCKLLPVPVEIFDRVKAQRDALSLHDSCNRILVAHDERPKHWLAEAVQSTSQHRGRAATRAGQQLNQRAARSRHDWDVSVAGNASSKASVPPVLLLDGLIDVPLDLFQLHARFFNQLFGCGDDDGHSAGRDSDSVESSCCRDESTGCGTACRGQSTELELAFSEEEIADIVDVFLLEVSSSVDVGVSASPGGGDLQTAAVENDELHENFSIDSAVMDALEDGDIRDSAYGRTQVWADICSSEGSDFEADLSDKFPFDDVDGAFSEAGPSRVAFWRPVGSRWVKEGSVSEAMDGMVVPGISALAEESAGDVVLAFALAEDSDSLQDDTAVDDLHEDVTDKDALCLGSSPDSGALHVCPDPHGIGREQDSLDSALAEDSAFVMHVTEDGAGQFDEHVPLHDGDGGCLEQLVRCASSSAVADASVQGENEGGLHDASVEACTLQHDNSRALAEDSATQVTEDLDSEGFIFGMLSPSLDGILHECISAGTLHTIVQTTLRHVYSVVEARTVSTEQVQQVTRWKDLLYRFQATIERTTASRDLWFHRYVDLKAAHHERLDALKAAHLQLAKLKIQIENLQLLNSKLLKRAACDQQSTYGKTGHVHDEVTGSEQLMHEQSHDDAFLLHEDDDSDLHEQDFLYKDADSVLHDFSKMQIRMKRYKFKRLGHAGNSPVEAHHSLQRERGSEGAKSSGKSRNRPGRRQRAKQQFTNASAGFASSSIVFAGNGDGVCSSTGQDQSDMELRPDLVI